MNARLQQQIIDLTQPYAMEGWCTPEKASILAELILARQPRLLVEIGVFGGKSLIPMALCLREIGEGISIGIDPWELDAAIEGDNGPEHNEWWSKNVDLERIHVGFVKKVLELELTKQCRWLRARSERAVCLFDDESIDFLHLDGNHSELASCRDVALWEPKMKENSVWVLDDSNWQTQSKAVEMIKAAGWKTFYDCTTYQVLERDAKTKSNETKVHSPSETTIAASEGAGCVEQCHAP